MVPSGWTKTGRYEIRRGPWLIKICGAVTDTKTGERLLLVDLLKNDVRQCSYACRPSFINDLALSVGLAEDSNAEM